MDKEQLEKKIKSCLESTQLSETEKIDELINLQEKTDNINDILGIDSDQRIQILEAAKKQLKDDQILNSFITEKDLDLENNQTAKR